MGVDSGVGIGVGSGVGVGAGVAVGGGRTRSSVLIPPSLAAIHIHAPTINPREKIPTNETALSKPLPRNREGFAYRGV